MSQLSISRSSWMSSLPIIVSLLALGIGFITLYFIFEYENNQIIIDCTGEDCGPAIENANRTLERADDATQSAELILSFLEGFSVLAGLVLVAAGVLGITSVQELRQDTEGLKAETFERLAQAEITLNQRVVDAETKLAARIEQLALLEKKLEETLAQSQTLIEEEIKNATEQAEQSFEALSHHLMAQRLARENNIAAAIKAGQEAYEIDPENIPNNYLLGLLMMRRGSIEEAITHLNLAYQESLEDDNFSHSPTKAALGLAIRRKGDAITDMMIRNQLYNQAENYLLQATTEDPQLVNEQGESYFGVLGSLYRRQGRTDDAIGAYSRAAAVTPRRSYPEINLAMLYTAKNDKEKIIRHLALAEAKALSRLRDTPDDYWAKHDMALAMLLKHDAEAAVKLFLEAIDLTPDIMTLDSIIARLEYARTFHPPLEGVGDVIAHMIAGREKFTS